MSLFVSHSILALLLSASLIFLLIYAGALRTLPEKYYDFDPQRKPGGFEPHAKRYQDLARLVITLSTASVAFLVNFLVTIPSGTNTPTNRYSLAIAPVAPLAIGAFSLSVLSLIIFLLIENYCYEQYCHSTGKNTYTRKKYAANVAFGYSGLLWFFLGYAILALRLLTV